MRIRVKHPQKKRTAQDNWPITYRWLAMGTLVAYSAVGSETVDVAFAQDLPNVVRSGPAAGQTQGSQPTRRFDIPAGPLDTVLGAFEQATQIAITISKEGLRSLSSPGVSGLYTTDQALQKILTNTGLTYRFTSASAVSVELASVSTAVEVTTSVDALAANSPKFSQPALETPQTITAVPQEVMQQQGVTTLRDALRNVAGISLAAGEGGAQGDNLTIRGFAARNDLFIDGMRDFGSYYRDPFNTQEVEVLQGPSSVIFGRGSTGGVVNQATKSPGLAPFISGEADFGTDGTRRGLFDVNHPVGLLGNGASFRLNVMGTEGGVAGRDVAENRRFGVAPSLALGLGTPTRWTFSYFHQNAGDTPDYGIPWLFNGPAPVAHKNYYGFRDDSYLRTHDDIGTAKVEHDVNSHVTLRNQARYANYVRNVLVTEAQVPAGVTLATPLNSIAVTRHLIGADSTETFLDEQLDVVAHFERGGLRHDFVAGIEAGRETSDPTRPTWTNVPNANLVNPNPDDPFGGTKAITSIVHTTALSAAAYALDTVKIGKHWGFTGGVRWDRMDADYSQTVASASAFHRVDNMPSWRAAAVYKPVAAGSVYFSAGTSFNPSAESLALSATTASLPPEKNRTLEAGTKWDLPHNRLSFQAALFQTKKLNAREPDPTNSLLNVLAGTQRANGAQMEIRSKLTSRWDLMASYALLDAKLARSNFYPQAIGAHLANVPRNTFNFWSTYRFPHRWETGFGGNFVSSRTASSTAPLDPVTKQVKQVPSYWVFNAMVKRPIREHIDFQANVTNLADRYYYDALHPAHIILGASRSALIGLKFKF